MKALQTKYPKLFHPVTIAVIGILVGVFLAGLIFWNQFESYLMNIITEIIGIAATVFIIETRNREQVEQRDIENCAFLMSSKNHATAIEAVERAKSRDWLENGKFASKKFCEANLAGARLGFDRQNNRCGRHNLSGADFSRAKLEGAFFHHCNLSNANYEKADLQKVNFYDANVAGVNFRGANLGWANFEKAKGMDKAFFDETTTMPHKKPYTKGMDLKQFTDRYAVDGKLNPEFRKHGPKKLGDVPYEIRENAIENNCSDQ